MCCTLLPVYLLPRDPILGEVAEIFHDADTTDERYGRPEPEGPDVIIKGMQLALLDYVLVLDIGPAFDGLCVYLSREVLPSPR